jgi:hypothetical protein
VEALEIFLSYLISSLKLVYFDLTLLVVGGCIFNEELFLGVFSLVDNFLLSISGVVTNSLVGLLLA